MTFHPLKTALTDDACRHCMSEKTLAVCKKLGDWGFEITKNLSEELFQVMLRGEFGSINESYYDLYALTGEEKYLKMGARFYHHAILDPRRATKTQALFFIFHLYSNVQNTRQKICHRCRLRHQQRSGDYCRP